MNFPYKTICVFCGSADGLDHSYYDAAFEMGKTLAQRDIALVFGAGRTGMMGALAEGVLSKNGQIIGVVPLGLESPQLVYTSGLTRIEVVDNIQIRKARMNELADAFIALPGGFGTMDELFEVLTWSQIGVHKKPTALLNTNGYYDNLLDWIDRAYADHYIYEEHLALFVVDQKPVGLLDRLQKFVFPEKIERWLDREQE